jgi:Rod binding domain-containing protein
MNISYPTSALDRWIPDKNAATPAKALTAAKDFESLLIGQMLHSARESGSGWLGTDDDDAAGTAVGFGEDELAKALANSGGLGLAHIIASGLAPKATDGDPQA